ncbi:hypothetical protein PICSAR136_00941 [Mycobacterium avium subsp. paratuberculosis]|nr:hypothetical protein PICSAR118_04461 [Mycobacterium avium subsp. paratuberculosis]CAG6939272.1 hypothetical protein PICSAR124_04487 [Mycobacterium avium subsp. paratuberculosis]CAG7028118.1 hypothetical protein PICSAR140_04507 [Mycobacterium avium subsp. paratuberculosis]CAG7029816.1 hypothetical protein PICSAR162_04577 [Mycobacterium avium subsp. paratuberculosis]CAG7048409.1 hypothetical protein PICSAR18_01546 [Mycobacterium avium subsp. paratuberculosis]
MLTPPPTSGATCASPAVTATITPPAGSAAINAPRAATNRAASGSDNTPATHAAAISPTECPITTSGVTPKDSHNAANATSNTNNAGWANSVLCNNSGSAPHITSRTGSRECSSTTATASSNARANTTNLSYSCRPIPNVCEP